MAGAGAVSCLRAKWEVRNQQGCEALQQIWRDPESGFDEPTFRALMAGYITMTLEPAARRNKFPKLSCCSSRLTTQRQTKQRAGRADGQLWPCPITAAGGAALGAFQDDRRLRPDSGGRTTPHKRIITSTSTPRQQTWLRSQVDTHDGGAVVC